jgi:hypothetical protein
MSRCRPESRSSSVRTTSESESATTASSMRLITRTGWSSWPESRTGVRCIAGFNCRQFRKMHLVRHPGRVLGRLASFDGRTASADGGSCSIPWANDTYDRSYTVHDNGDGTFKVTADSRHGTFVTTGPGSPGACETTDRHGSTVSAGVTGGFQGFITGTVTGSTYDPAGCASADCSTSGAFIAAVFGPSADFTCFDGFAGCDFYFEYHSSDQSLQYRDWQDKSDNHLGEEFVGDIANS